MAKELEGLEEGPKAEILIDLTEWMTKGKTALIQEDPLKEIAQTTADP